MLAAELERLLNMLGGFTNSVNSHEYCLLGKTDGTPKTADWAAVISGIPADPIRTLARETATKRTLVTVG